MNVLYIDIDSLRADRLGMYGHEAPTTPELDRFAEDAVVFDRSYVACSPCMPSRAGFVSGRYGVHNGIVTHGPQAQTLRSPKQSKDWFAGWAEEWTFEGNGLKETTGESAEWLTLPEVFFHERVHTAAVSSFPRHTAPWFYHLWHEFHQPQEPEGRRMFFMTPQAEDVVDTARDVLERNDDPVFCYAQFWEPHLPYTRPDEEVAGFADTPMPPYPTEDDIAAHHEWELSTAAQMEVESREDLRRLYASYDAEIRHVDREVGRLLEYLRETGRYDETMVVVTGDHGEEFGEHGMYVKHGNVHDASQRVPLLVKPPASADYEPGHRDQLVTNVDLAPTLVDYAGLDRPAQWQGRSLRPVLADPDADWRDHVVLDHGLYTAQRAVRTDRWKYVRTLHPGGFADVVPERALYDMHEDPHEQANLHDDRPAVVEDLETRMLRWVDEHVGRGEDPMHELARTGPASYPPNEAYWSQNTGR
ncbi:sulfatase [Haloglomus litoreum]|uniref:sulfatase family protein n=1 Tax=Haloglomus litoreum TaxID=3034026 RepID=UPI0023E77244|nr:sulfatase [Haloglomus sp. DT116]